MQVFQTKGAGGREAVDVVGDALLGREGVAAIANVSVRTIHNWIRAGRFPKPDLRPTPKSPRWRASTVRAWMESGN